MTAPEDLLTVDEVAALVRLPAGTLRSWRCQSKDKPQGPRSFKLGRRVVYSRADVEAWIEQQRETTSLGGAA